MGFYTGSIALDELLVLGLEASGEEAQRLGLIYPAQTADVMALLVQLDYRVSHIVQVRLGVYASGNGQADGLQLRHMVLAGDIVTSGRDNAALHGAYARDLI